MHNNVQGRHIGRSGHLKRLARSILPGAYPVLRLVRLAGKSLGVASPGRLRVLLYHDIAPGEHSRFAAQIRWLSRRWFFVSPERFAAMMSGNEPIIGDNLLLTFDDGFASNRLIAEEILNPLGIRAIFFVVSEFAALENHEQARRYIAEHLYPGRSVESIPAHWRNMGWDDLEALQEQGHLIGAHTASHARLSELTTKRQLEKEIIGGADALEKRLGCPIEHFAYPFGDFKSFSPEALAVAASRFRYVYSGLRGDNFDGVSPLAIRRDPIAAQESCAMVGVFLEGGSDLRYRKQATLLNTWARGAV